VAGRLRITSGEAAGRVVEIDGEVAFGRKGEGPGKLPGDVEVSRLHARVYMDADGGLTIEDAGSTNGTFVRGRRITGPTPVSPGDAVRMGQTELEVEAWAPAEPLAEQEAPPPPEPEPAREPAPRPAGTGVPKPLVWVLIGVLLLAAAGIAAVVILTGEDDDERDGPQARGVPTVATAASEAGCTARDLPPEGDREVPAAQQVTYRSNPPHSGDYSEKPAEDGIWETAPPLPRIVSALEKGRVAMWHKPGDEKGQELLREVGDQSPSHMLLVPSATMPYRVAVTAWGHVLGCPRINGSTPAAVRAFRDAYRDKAPSFEP
jgi:hypothetical protein